MLSLKDCIKSVWNLRGGFSGSLDKIISSINFEAPFSLVTDYLHKFNIGDNIEITNELGDLNIKQCIIEYIESLDIDNKEEVINRTVHLYNQFV